MSYNPQGTLASKTNARGETITFTYDDGRLLSTEYGGMVHSYSYDLLGRQISATNNEVDLFYVYDTEGRITSIDNRTLGEVITFEYDAIGNKIAMAGPKGRTEYRYDSNNRIVEISDPSGGAFRFEYDALGRRTKLLYPNQAQTDYAYDELGRITSLLTRDRSGIVTDGFTYEYDAMGNRLSQVALRDGVPETYGYDLAERLVRWERNGNILEYSYDAVGNRVALSEPGATTTYSYDAANRLIESNRQSAAAVSHTSYEWDLDGNQVRVVADSAVESYSYDALNRMTAATTLAGAFSYGYDASGQRFRESGPTGDRFHLADGQDVLAVFEGGVVEESFTHGPAIDEPLAQWNQDGVHYLHHDALGSITSSSDTGGSRSGFRRYRPFGTIEESDGVDSRYAFTAREADPTGLYYYRARYYDQEVGRFTSLDPVGSGLMIPKTLNGFDYGFNNPTRFVDPYGTSPIGAIGIKLGKIAIGAAIIGSAVNCMLSGWETQVECLVALGGAYAVSPATGSGIVFAIFAYLLGAVLIVKTVLQAFNRGEIGLLSGIFLITGLLAAAAFVAIFIFMWQAYLAYNLGLGWAAQAAFALIVVSIFAIFATWALNTVAANTRHRPRGF